MYRKYFKRFLDIIMAFSGLLILSPILILLMILLAVVNRGKIFFTQERPGRDEKVFRVIKFRSMNDKRDANGKLLPDRERITPIGKFIRATSLDELPQLIHILKGEMSLIGPRPLLPRYLPFYTEREKKRHTVRPGMTGLAQVSGRNLIGWDVKLELDVHYVENISFFGDLKIFWLSVIKVIKREGAIANKKENYLDIEREKKILKL